MRNLALLLSIVLNMGIAQASITWEKGLTPLQWAIVEGDLNLAKQLIKKTPALVNTLTKIYNASPLTSLSEWSTLQIAVIHEKPNMVAELINNGADLEYRDSRDGFSALHLAAQKKNGGMELLLKAGADVDSISGSGHCFGCRDHVTPLWVAVDHENENAFNLLLKYGANPHVEQSHDYPSKLINAITYMMRCSTSGIGSREVCLKIRMRMLHKILEYRGLEINVKNGLLNTYPIGDLVAEVPGRISSGSDGETAKERSLILIKAIRALVDQGGDICLEHYGRSALTQLSNKAKKNTTIQSYVRELESRFNCRS